MFCKNFDSQTFSATQRLIFQNILNIQNHFTLNIIQISSSIHHWLSRTRVVHFDECFHCQTTDSTMYICSHGGAEFVGNVLCYPTRHLPLASSISLVVAKVDTCEIHGVIKHHLSRLKEALKSKTNVKKHTQRVFPLLLCLLLLVTGERL